MPSHRILFALSLSLSLHLAAFAAADLLCSMQEPRLLPKTLDDSLDVTLRLPTPAAAFEPILKNTLPAPVKRPAKVALVPKPTRTPMATLESRPSIQRKLAEHVFYPAEAIAAGIEGKSRVLLTLDERGRVVDVQLAASSGHAILDQAAIRAAYAMGSLPGQNQREIILPVEFRLQP
jgi:protein TonB